MKEIILIENVWSQEKCDSYITKSESLGYSKSAVNTPMGQRIVQDVRNNYRLFFESPELASELWDTIKEHIPQKLGLSKATGLNELFRFYKYEPGQQFRKHQDESFIKNETEASYYTLLLYLNDNYEGGETAFRNQIIQPKAGSMLVFLHQLEHEGKEVLSGRKYVLRTDVMYKLIE